MQHRNKRPRDTSSAALQTITNIFSSQPKNIHEEWKENFGLSIKLAEMIIKRASSCGVSDQEVLREYVYFLILKIHRYGSNPVLQEWDVGRNQGYEMREILRNKFKERLERTVILVNHPDFERVIKQIMNEHDHAVIRNLFTIIYRHVMANHDDDYLSDFIAIYLFLSNEEQVLPYIKKLEEGMQNYASNLPEGKKLPQRDDGKYYLPAPQKNSYERFKILSGYLYEWAQTVGFRQRVKIFGQISQSTFLETLGNRAIQKDSGGAGIPNNPHGVWAHTTQIYFMTEHNRATRFLKHHAIDVIYQLSQAKSSDFQNKSAIWNLLFEGALLNKMGFTEQTRVHHYLIGLNTNDMPLLAETIARLEYKYKHGVNMFAYQKRLREKHNDVENKGIAYLPLSSHP